MGGFLGGFFVYRAAILDRFCELLIIAVFSSGSSFVGIIGIKGRRSVVAKKKQQRAPVNPELTKVKSVFQRNVHMAYKVQRTQKSDFV